MNSMTEFWKEVKAHRKRKVNYPSTVHGEFMVTMGYLIYLHPSTMSCTMLFHIMMSI